MYLEKRPDGYYAILRIPQDVSETSELEVFQGKKKVLKKLGAISEKKAQLEANALVSTWKKQIELQREINRASQDNPTTNFIKTALAYREALKNAPKALFIQNPNFNPNTTFEDFTKDNDREFNTTDPLIHIPLPNNQADSYEIEELLSIDLEKLWESGNHHEAIEVNEIARGIKTPLAPLFKKWSEQLTDYEPKTADSYKRDAKFFVEKFKILEAVNKRSVKLWVTTLIDEGMSVNTVRNRVIKGVRNFWNYLVERDIIPEGQERLLLDVVPKEKKTKQSKLATGRNQFTPEELTRIYKAIDKDDHQLMAVTSIAMFTGCRIEEICQIKADGVKTIDEVECFVISDSKTKAGYRDIPVHSKLKPLVKKLLSESTDGYLISELTFNKWGDRSNAVGKRFGHLKTSLGFPKKTKVFHTIRNCVITQLDRNQVPINVIKDFVGHDKSDQTMRYMAKTDMKTLKKTVELIRYPSI